MLDMSPHRLVRIPSAKDFFESQCMKQCSRVGAFHKFIHHVAVFQKCPSNTQSLAFSGRQSLGSRWGYPCLATAATQEASNPCSFRYSSLAIVAVALDFLGLELKIEGIHTLAKMSDFSLRHCTLMAVQLCL